MCARYFIDDEMAAELEQLVNRLDKERKAARGKGDICPSMAAPILYKKEKERYLSSSRFGFHSRSGKGLVINARAESASGKGMFHDSFAYRRCIISARGFYEWDSSQNQFIFTDKEKSLLYMAGLFQYENNESRFVILTTSANSSMQPVHDRMPLLLQKAMITDWLFDDLAAEELLKFIPKELNKYCEMEQMRLDI